MRHHTSRQKIPCVFSHASNFWVFIITTIRNYQTVDYFLNFMAREGNSSKNNKNCYITRGPEIVFEFVRKKLRPAERVVRGFRLSFVFMLCIEPFINQTFHSSIIAQRERVCLLFPLKTSIKSHSIAFLFWRVHLGGT